MMQETDDAVAPFANVHALINGVYNDIDYFVVLILISAHLPRYSLITDPKDPTFARREKIDGARLLRVIRIVDLSTCSDFS